MEEKPYFHRDPRLNKIERDQVRRIGSRARKKPEGESPEVIDSEKLSGEDQTPEQDES